MPPFNAKSREPAQGHAPDGTAPRRRLRTRVLLGVNVVLVIGVAILLAIDYRIQTNDAIQSKLDGLNEEAKTLSEAVYALRHHGEQAIQDHIDRVCARMRDTTSPGHHIVVEAGSQVIQARTHDRDSLAMLRSLREAAGADARMVTTGDQQILVGIDRRPGIVAYVSENLSNVQRQVRYQLLWHLLGLGALGLVGAAVVNLILMRLVTQPLDRLVAVVERAAQEEFGETVEPPPTAELAYLAEEINAMSSALARAKDHRQHAMTKARRIQAHLLPDPVSLRDTGSLVIHRPAEDVGGDLFDLYRWGDGRCIFCLADITGHGVPAAMGAAMLKTLFTTAIEQTSDPSQLLAAINQRFLILSPAEMFATAIIVQVDRTLGRVRYASAGHEPCYLMRPNREHVTLNSTGTLLGILGAADWETKELAVQPGERLVLVTDGVPETASMDGVLFGRERLEHLLDQDGSRSPQAICERILQAVTDHRGGCPAQDDVTVVAVEV
jgi:phosphoserine phosphatase RsbU/P